MVTEKNTGHFVNLLADELCQSETLGIHFAVSTIF
jgi:hypothetical protein